jgi:hypothetical protein
MPTLTESEVRPNVGLKTTVSSTDGVSHPEQSEGPRFFGFASE